MPQPAKQAITELSVTGRLMALDAGAYCVFHAPGTASADMASGLPGVRISVPPAANGYEGTVQLAGFAEGGWLAGSDDAALIRIVGGPAQVLVTVYEMPGAGQKAPQLQVIRLSPDLPAPQPVAVPTPPVTALPEISAHVYGRGDVAGELGAWVGDRGSKRWIEGFGLAPQSGLVPGDIEYQAVLGRGWMSPWSEGGQFCGSRGMSLPLLGIRVRLRGAAAGSLTLRVHGTFVDGTAVGPVGDGDLLESPNLAALEAFRIDVLPRQDAPARLVQAKTTTPKATQGKATQGKANHTKPMQAKPVQAKPVQAKPTVGTGRKPGVTAKATEAKLKTKAKPTPTPVPVATPTKSPKKIVLKRTPATTRRR